LAEMGSIAACIVRAKEGSREFDLARNNAGQISANAWLTLG
jgi:hypothetical protein